MAHVAREMERRGLNLPLLIGGATTSKRHTAVKIAPAYSARDDSRHRRLARGAGGRRIDEARDAPGARPQNRKDQQEIREQFENRAGTQLLTYEEAHAHRLHTEWDDHHIAVPEFIGRRVLNDFPLEELVPYIDWSPFFHTWEMRGRYPDLLHDPVRGPAARELFANAQELLREIVDEKLFTAHGVYGFYPANSDGDDIIVYSDRRDRNVDAPAYATPTEREPTR